MNSTESEPRINEIKEEDGATSSALNSAEQHTIGSTTRVGDQPVEATPFDRRPSNSKKSKQGGKPSVQVQNVDQAEVKGLPATKVIKKSPLRRKTSKTSPYREVSG